LASDEPCSQTTPGAKKDKLRIKILDKIDHDPVLKKQYHGYGEYPPGHHNDPPRFSFEVTEGQYGTVEVHFKGDVSGPGQLEALVDFLDNYEKKGCLEKVTFTPGPVTEAAGTTRSATAGDGFEWVYCEYPKVACPNGECQETCNGGGTNANIPANSNTNTNTNGNTNRVNSNLRERSP